MLSVPYLPSNKTKAIGQGVKSQHRDELESQGLMINDGKAQAKVEASMDGALL